MIAKATGRGHSFAGATAYYMHDKGKAKTRERVAWTATGNMPTNDPNKAHKWMAYTHYEAPELKRQAGVKSTGAKLKNGPVYTFVLAGYPEDKGRFEQTHWLENISGALKHQGLDKHQFYAVAHNDTDHDHVHVVVNLVNHMTGKIADLTDNHYKLQEWALKYEKEYEQGKDYTPQREANAIAREKGENVKYSERIMKDREYIKDAYERASNGQEFANLLKARGLELANGDQRGYVVVDEQGKAHSLTRQLNKQSRQNAHEKLGDMGDLRASRDVQREREAYLKAQHAERIEKRSASVNSEEKEQSKAPDATTERLPNSNDNEPRTMENFQDIYADGFKERQREDQIEDAEKRQEEFGLLIQENQDDVVNFSKEEKAQAKAQHLEEQGDVWNREDYHVEQNKRDAQGGYESAKEQYRSEQNDTSRENVNTLDQRNKEPLLDDQQPSEGKSRPLYPSAEEREDIGRDANGNMLSMEETRKVEEARREADRQQSRDQASIAGAQDTREGANRPETKEEFLNRYIDALAQEDKAAAQTPNDRYRITDEQREQIKRDEQKEHMRGLDPYDAPHLRELDLRQAWEATTQRDRLELENYLREFYKPVEHRQKIRDLEKELTETKGIFSSRKRQRIEAELAAERKTLNNIDLRIDEAKQKLEVDIKARTPEELKAPEPDISQPPVQELSQEPGSRVFSPVESINEEIARRELQDRQDRGEVAPDQRTNPEARQEPEEPNPEPAPKSRYEPKPEQKDIRGERTSMREGIKNARGTDVDKSRGRDTGGYDR